MGSAGIAHHVGETEVAWPSESWPLGDPLPSFARAPSALCHGGRCAHRRADAGCYGLWFKRYGGTGWVGDPGGCYPSWLGYLRRHHRGRRRLLHHANAIDYRDDNNRGAHHINIHDVNIHNIDIDIHD